MWAVAIMTVACFGILFGSIIALAALGVTQVPVFVPIALFGSLGIVGVAAMMLRFISHFASSSMAAERIESRPRREIVQPPPPQLARPADYVPSVTEHTTRIFDGQSEK